MDVDGGITSYKNPVSSEQQPVGDETECVSDNSSWYHNLGRLVAYKALHVQSTKVPFTYNDNAGISLDLWLDRQRREYDKHKRGETSMMTHQRILALDFLGLDWKVERAGKRSEAVRVIDENDIDGCMQKQGLPAVETNSVDWAMIRWFDFEKIHLSNARTNEEKQAAAERAKQDWRLLTAGVMGTSSVNITRRGETPSAATPASSQIAAGSYPVIPAAKVVGETPAGVPRASTTGSTRIPDDASRPLTATHVECAKTAPEASDSSSRAPVAYPMPQFDGTKLAADSKWRYAVDPRSGRAYYYHIETRETRWTPTPQHQDGGIPEEPAGLTATQGRSENVDVPPHSMLPAYPWYPYPYQWPYPYVPPSHPAGDSETGRNRAPARSQPTTTAIKRSDRPDDHSNAAVPPEYGAEEGSSLDMSAHSGARASDAEQSYQHLSPANSDIAGSADEDRRPKRAKLSDSKRSHEVGGGAKGAADEPDAKETPQDEPDAKETPRRTAKHVDTWDTLYRRLVSFREKHGHACGPKRGEDPQLGRWVVRQRGYYRQKNEGIKVSLCDDRIAMLNSIDFQWQVLNPTHTSEWHQMRKKNRASKASTVSRKLKSAPHDTASPLPENNLWCRIKLWKEGKASDLGLVELSSREHCNFTDVRQVVEKAFPIGRNWRFFVAELDSQVSLVQEKAFGPVYGFMRRFGNAQAGSEVDPLTLLIREGEQCP